MKTTADVVIIGGGVAGVSALYYLSENGIRNVLLVEMDKIGSGTTAHTSADITLQEPLEIISRLSLISYPEFPMFKEKFGVDIGFRKAGSLSIDINEYSDKMLERANFQQHIGIQTEVLTPDEIKSIASFLNVNDIGRGLLCKEGGPIDPYPFMQTYIKHAKERGAEVREGVKAINIIVQNGKVIGVETTDDTISTPIVINAAGIYAGIVGKWIGIDIPIINALRHTLRTEPISLAPKDMPMIEVLNPEEIYIAIRGNCLDFSLGFDETGNYVHAPNLEVFWERYGNAIIHRMPLLENLGIQSVEAGIRSMSPDDIPILGPVDTISGYINDCCWGGSGVSLGPGGGKLIAECILSTKNLPLNIEPFLLSRFQKRD